LKLKALLLLVEPKGCFWSSIVNAPWYSLSVPHLIILAHFLAIGASYRCSAHPKGIPLASSKTGLFLGRSIRVSDYAAVLHANNTVSIVFFHWTINLCEPLFTLTHIGHQGKPNSFKLLLICKVGKRKKYANADEMSGRLMLY